MEILDESYSPENDDYVVIINKGGYIECVCHRVANRWLSTTNDFSDPHILSRIADSRAFLLSRGGRVYDD